MSGPIRYRNPANVPDGRYSGTWSGYTLRWEHEGQEVEAMTKIGVRGMNVPVVFNVKDNLVDDNSIETIGPSRPLHR